MELINNMVAENNSIILKKLIEPYYTATFIDDYYNDITYITGTTVSTNILAKIYKNTNSHYTNNTVTILSTDDDVINWCINKINNVTEEVSQFSEIQSSDLFNILYSSETNKYFELSFELNNDDSYATPILTLSYSNGDLVTNLEDYTYLTYEINECDGYYYGNINLKDINPFSSTYNNITTERSYNYETGCTLTLSHDENNFNIILEDKDKYYIDNLDSNYEIGICYEQNTQTPAITGSTITTSFVTPTTFTIPIPTNLSTGYYIFRSYVKTKAFVSYSNYNLILV